MDKSYFFSLILPAAILIGCGEPNREEASQSLPGSSVTIWTSKSELFMEYPALIIGQEARFAVHLTWLSDFKAVADGVLTLEFTSDSGLRQSTRLDRPTSPGIYRPSITFEHPGSYDLTMIVDGAERDTLRVSDVRVYSSADEYPAEANDPRGEQLISFLKEQQWNIEFRTEPIILKQISQTVRATAEIIPRVNNEAIVSAPFSGFVPADFESDLPVAGKIVEKGAHLAMLVPSAETPGGLEDFSSRYIDAETGRRLTEKELERVKRLRAIDAASEKEYQEAEAVFERADATYRLLGRSVNGGSGNQSSDGFSLTAPLSGTIIDAHVVPGKYVDAGEPLFRIINTRTVWIRANIGSPDIGRLRRPSRAWLQLAGAEGASLLDERNSRLISIASAIDRETRSFPVIFETRNSDGGFASECSEPSSSRQVWRKRRWSFLNPR